MNGHHHPITTSASANANDGHKTDDVRGMGGGTGKTPKRRRTTSLGQFLCYIYSFHFYFTNSFLDSTPVQQRP
jgi:hypothetical protein